MKKLWAASSAFASIWLTAALASASNYVCNANLFPGSSTAGTFGNVGFTLYTGPHCTGTFVRTYDICSAGSTYRTCVANSAYWMPTARATIAMSTALREAALYAYPVTVSTQQCIGPRTDCVSLVNFN